MKDHRNSDSHLIIDSHTIGAETVSFRYRRMAWVAKCPTEQEVYDLLMAYEECTVMDADCAGGRHREFDREVKDYDEYLESGGANAERLEKYFDLLISTKTNHPN